MKKNLICMAVATTFGFAAFNASAEDMYRGAWYALPGIGYNWTDSDVDSDDDVAAHLRFGKELSEHWDIQIGGTYTRADEDSKLSTGGKYKQTLLGVDALYMFSRDKFRPFVLAGLGYAHNDIDYSNANWGSSRSSAMANVGAGFQYLFSDKWGMQADVREVWSEAKTGLQGNRDTETIANTLLSLGVIYRFGEPAPAPVARPEPEPMPAPAPVAAAPEPMPAPPPAPAPAAFEKITLASEVLFDFDKDNVKESGKKILDADVVEKMKAHPEVELVLITGHSDRIGEAGYNLSLSERRANNVKSYLTSQGIAENRLHAIGKGEAEPVVECKGVRGQAAIDCLQPNRRVVVEIEEQR
jgi:OOP family OmpA-OmpF porin